jgi:hypothetical protein
MLTERKVADGGYVVGSAQSDGWVLSFPLFACNQGLDFLDKHWRWSVLCKVMYPCAEIQIPEPEILAREGARK